MSLTSVISMHSSNCESLRLCCGHDELMPVPPFALLCSHVQAEMKQELAKDRQVAPARSRRAVPSQAQLEEAITEAVRSLIGADVAPDAPLAAQGLDSLTSMELRHKLQVGSPLPHCPCTCGKRYNKGIWYQ